MAAGNALKADSIIGDTLQIIVTAEGAECLVHPHGERPQSHTDLEFFTAEYQPWMNVCQHGHFPEQSTPPSAGNHLRQWDQPPIRPKSALHDGNPHAGGEQLAITRFCVDSSQNDGCTNVGAENSADPEGFSDSAHA